MDFFQSLFNNLFYSCENEPVQSFDIPVEINNPQAWNNYLFEGDVGVRAKQNNEIEDYNLANYFNHQNPICAATSQVGMVPTGHQFNIDASNKLAREGTVRILHTGCRMDEAALLPFVGIPNLERNVNLNNTVYEENKIIYANQHTYNSRCNMQTMEKDYFQYTEMPLIPTAQQMVGKNALLYIYDMNGVNSRRVD